MTKATVSHIELKRKKRRRKCPCEPRKFRQWLKRGNSIRNKMDPRITFTNGDFDFSRGNRVPFLRGYAYQYYVTKEYDEYKAFSTSHGQWVDGRVVPLCALVEAKYIMPNRKVFDLLSDKSPLPELLKEAEKRPNPFPTETDREAKEFKGGTIDRRIRRQFKGYGKLVNSPAAPAKECWHIELYCYVSQWGQAVAQFAALMLINDIPGFCTYRGAPGEKGMTYEDR